MLILSTLKLSTEKSKGDIKKLKAFQGGLSDEFSREKIIGLISLTVNVLETILHC